MSAYYDDGPFKIDQWNKLIEDVNEKLQNPPGNCDPIDPLDTVEDPYIWLVEDVEKVREKIKQTCPDIEFTKDTVIWKKEIINEIESKMDEMWCDCEECDYSTEVLGEHTVDMTFAEGYPGYDGGTDGTSSGSSGFCSFCPALDYLEWYVLEQFMPEVETYNENIYNQIHASDLIASEAVNDFQYYLERTLTYANQIDTKQAELDTLVRQVDSYIAMYESLNCDAPAEENITHCAAIKTQICNAGNLAKTKQTSLNTAYDKFVEYYDLMEEKRILADTKAAQNVIETASLLMRLPNDWYGTLWAISLILAAKLDWWKSFNPKNPDCTVKPTIIHTRKMWGSFPQFVINISPNGTPIFSAQGADRLLIEATMGHYQVHTRDRCCAFPISCAPLDTCDWTPWTYMDWYWTFGDVYQAIPIRPGIDPIPDLSWYSGHWNQLSVYGKLDHLRLDFTEERDEFFNSHRDWYTEHPKYDNRHEEYC